tara:strand:+ start:6312 stop:6677 length:366 start_codon:yes stop_codon:yes gene_type:complete
MASIFVVPIDELVPMQQKKLEELSKYESYDLDHDGTVTDDEISKSKEMTELELREEKSHAQKQMSWTAIASMVVFTLLLFTPLVSESRVAALADLLGLFYVGQASIVGFYFGAQAYMSRSR